MEMRWLMDFRFSAVKEKDGSSFSEIRASIGGFDDFLLLIGPGRGELGGNG